MLRGRKRRKERRGEKNRRRKGRREREEVVVSSREAHVPDHLSRRKDITLFAPIVPHCAETIKLCSHLGSENQVKTSQYLNGLMSGRFKMLMSG
jgi:hypothetical protein